MKKTDITAEFRACARDHLSPTPAERAFVSVVYQSVQDVLGGGNCLQIGSYPRFTAIRPMHDLDVLYVLGVWNPAEHDPSRALTDLEARLHAGYKNPTPHDLEIVRQTHSITLKFMRRGEEVFAVDIVPAYTWRTNEFGDDMYQVPEIAAQSRRDRRRTLEAVSKGSHSMTWISSDPRGYITVAGGLNQANEDFRRAVKLVKGWRHSCKQVDEDFPLKSFHLEQGVTRLFQQDPGIDVFDAVFRLFCALPDLIRHAQIPDRADQERYVDAYVEQLSHAERSAIDQARDFLLINLEEYAGGIGATQRLLSAGRYRRASVVEAYLFDEGIPMLTEQKFSIVATALVRTGGFRQRILDVLGLIDINREIQFRRGNDAPAADVFKWKVKNDNDSPQPRGEINDHRTRNDPEHTKYKGNHFVECFAVKDGACIGRAKQNVVLNAAYMAQ